jgi:hypothetical protein
MSLLYLHFEGEDRNSRVQKLARSGAHIVVAEPRWPGFYELAKREKPYAVAVDFSRAPSHALETADYIAKAKETRELPVYLLRVPPDRLDIVKKRLPQASIITEPELATRLATLEKEAEARAREKKEAAAQAKKLARAAAAAAGSGKAKKPAQAKPAPADKPPAPKAPVARKTAPPRKKSAARPRKKTK